MSNTKITSSSARKVKVAVVGLGFMGVTHLKAWQKIESAQIAAVCDAVRLPVNGVLAGVNGNLSGTDAIHLGAGVKAYKNLDDALGDPEVELVDLCVPTALHVPQAIAALRAGKHVICEKPLARTSAQAWEIAQVAKTARGYFMPAMCMRFWPEWAWLKRELAQGTYGRVLAARFRRVSEAPGWSKDTYLKGGQSGGALLDLHIHDSDFVQFLFGRPTSVYATGLSRYSGAIDHIVTQYQVPGGAVVSAEGSWLMNKGHGLGMAYTVNFEQATADFDLSRGKEALRLFEEGKEPRTIACEGPDGYETELRHMAASILAGTPPSVVTAADGVSAVEICEAEDLSIRHGQPMKVMSANAN
jgi:predicted dehydrogenase